MLEKHFENVLHRYPELIEEGLKFSGRQVCVGGKYVDLLFEDRFGQKLIIELKRGIIKREHIAQLLDYEGYFLTADNPNIRVMLIGNRVPPNLRVSLDHHGFEWKEIPVSELIKYLENIKDADLLGQFKEEEIQTTSTTETISIKKSKTSAELGSTRNGKTAKFIFDGSEYGTGRLVLAVIKKYIADNPSLDSKCLLEAFPKKIQGSWGVFDNEQKAVDKRHFNKLHELVTLTDCTIAVSSQWGSGNINNFIEQAKKLGYQIDRRQ